MFEKILKRSSWTDIVISIIFVLLGILLVTRPEETLIAISTILGILFIAMGALKLIEYFTTEKKQDHLLTIALIAVVFGVIILCASDAILSLFRIILGLWIITTGIMDFQTTLIWKEFKSPYWILALVLSIGMITSGIVLLINSNILITTIGILTIIYSVLDIVDRVIFIKKIDNYTK